MFSTRTIRARRTQAFLTLLCCVFWNTIGIATHNHDLIGGVSTIAAGCAHELPTTSLESSKSASAPVAPDTCPGCSYDAACVSSAVAIATIAPIPFAACKGVVQRAQRLAPSLPALTSRGPPTA